MRRRRPSPNVGEPLERGLLEQTDEYDSMLDRAQNALDTLHGLGRIATALQRSTRPSDPNTIDMVEVAPGVFARKPERPTMPGPLGRAQHALNTYRDLRQEVTGHARRRR